MNFLTYLRSELEKIQDLETERSYYPILKEFLIRFAKEQIMLDKEVNVISEASSKIHESKVGFPDLTVQVKNYDFQTVGWVEVKLPKDNLNDPKFQPQFSRYKDSLENILFTNLREWTLYQWDESGKPKKVDECLFDVTTANGNPNQFIGVLMKFFDGKALDIKTPKQLALALARKTRLLSQQIEDSLPSTPEEEKENDLVKLKNAFSLTLIKDLENHQFANMAAETIAYSFFLAALEHEKRGKKDLLTFTTAVDYLPRSVPVLSDLYSLIGRAAKQNEAIKLTVDSIIEQFRNAKMDKIYGDMIKHQKGQDPVIHFYEPFLNEYDPKEREARGVYYTPKPVVDYIVKSVDEILKDKFGKIAGISDPDVYLLDPATGTGTFLMSAIELIYQQKQRQFGALGDQIIRKEFVRTVQCHILKHFFGFELMIAPYAIAHLKLTMLLEEFGFDFEMTKNNDDDDDDRLKIFLANTLDEPTDVALIEKGQMAFSFHESISKESALASDVKTNKPIMAIIGNPPYSGHSSNNGDWIRRLVNDYYFVDGKPLNEKNPKWLQDDYVKFIRFAQWKISQTGEGVVGFITNHGYLDNPTFRGMRQNLLNSFNEIYILDLHGNSSKKEKTPEGGKDENVFNIKQGVAIVFLIKQANTDGCKIYRSDLYGIAKEKKAFLEIHDIKNTKWEELSPKGKFYLFASVNEEIQEQYNGFESINDVFDVKSIGIQTHRDSLVIDSDKEQLNKRIKTFVDITLADEEVKDRLNIVETNSWNIKGARQKLKSIDTSEYIKKILYRPFDGQYIFFHEALVDRTRKNTMCHMVNGKNLAIVTVRQVAEGIFNHCIVTDLISDSRVTLSNKGAGYHFPLYKFYDGESEPNINIKFTEKLNQDIEIELNSGTIIQVFDYLYGLLSLPSYRQKYAEQLKMDFPRIPLPSQAIESGLLPENIKEPKEAFERVSALGNKLRNLHLLTDPIFSDTPKWGVKPLGQKPDGFDDWRVTQVKYLPEEKRVYVNQGQYFEGIDPEVWDYHIGGYQVLEKWLKDRKKAERCLSLDDLMQYMKIVVSLRETIKAVKEFNPVKS